MACMGRVPPKTYLRCSSTIDEEEEHIAAIMTKVHVLLRAPGHLNVSLS